MAVTGYSTDAPPSHLRKGRSWSFYATQERCAAGPGIEWTPGAAQDIGELVHIAYGSCSDETITADSSRWPSPL